MHDKLLILVVLMSVGIGAQICLFTSIFWWSKSIRRVKNKIIAAEDSIETEGKRQKAAVHELLAEYRELVDTHAQEINKTNKTVRDAVQRIDLISSNMKRR